MTNCEQRRWVARQNKLLLPFWRFVQPPGRRIRLPLCYVYALVMRVHLWLWVRGVEI